MTDQDKAEILSRLPVKDLDDLRLILSIASRESLSQTVTNLAEIVTKAMDYKQAQMLMGYDQDDNQMTFI